MVLREMLVDDLDQVMKIEKGFLQNVRHILRE